MAEIINNQFPFKIYECQNLANTEAYVYLGKAALAGLNGATSSYFPDQVDRNCSTTFLFASIVGGRNVRVDPATEEDPYIYIDARWYSFRPCGNDSSTGWPANSILSSVSSSEAGDITVYVKSLTTDGSVVIEGGNDSFVWSDQGQAGDPFNDPSFCDLTLRTHRYDCANCCGPNGVYAGRKGIPGKSDVLFMFKSIFAGYCITIDYDGCSYTVNYDVENCDPCLFCEDGPPPTAIESAPNGACDPAFSLLDRPGWHFC